MKVGVCGFVLTTMLCSGVFAQAGPEEGEAPPVFEADSAQVQPIQEAAPVPVSQPPPQSAQCVPTCRSGFVCVHGTCVSACNPPCAAGSTCTAAGECVAQNALVTPVIQPFIPPGVTPERDAEHQRLRELRAQLRLGVFLDIGYMFIDGDGSDDIDGIEISAPHFAFGFELRKNFAYRVGVRLRAGVDIAVDSDEDDEGSDIRS